MYFDALTLSAVAEEMRERLRDGRVQEALLLDELTVGIEVYAPPRRHYVSLSAHPQLAHVLIVGEKVRRGVETASPLLLMLRRFVRDARLIAVDQVPDERILKLRFDNRETQTTLVAEIMGRHSNLILLDADDVIMDSVKRVGSDVNRFRMIQPRQPYVTPPPQDKLPPDDVTELRLRAVVEATDPSSPLWKGLVAGIKGMSPLLARELVFRACGKADLPPEPGMPVSPLLEEFARLVPRDTREPWAPSVALSGEDPVAFAPYQLRHLGRWVAAEAISAAAERYLKAQTSRDPYAASRARVRQVVDAARKQVDRKRQSLQRSLVGNETLDRLRLSGEMVLAYAHQVRPGQTHLQVDLGDPDGALNIELDPARTPSENAQEYFDRYTRSKKAAKEVPPLLQELELQDRYLEQLAADLQMAGNAGEIDEIRSALEEAGYVKPGGKRSKSARSRPLVLNSVDGISVLIGKNSRQNEEVTFDRSAGNDIWLHARGVPGAHVIVRSEGRPVPRTTLMQAAAWAAYFSTGRSDGSVAVDYTERRYVRKIKGAAPGLVTYRNETTLQVAPAAPDSVSPP